MRNLLIICSFFLLATVQAQDSLYVTFDKKIEGAFTYLAPDGLGNLLLVTQSGQLRKYNASMDSIGSYNALKQLGKMHSIASFNALKTGVFFSQFKTILVLDRFLREVSRIDLRKAQLYQVNAVAQSFDNKWWIFDEQESKLKKMGDDGRIELETPDMRILVGESASPTVVFDQQRNVYMYDPAQGMYIFDQMGGFRKKLGIPAWRDVQAYGNGFVGVNKNQLLVYSADKLDIQSYLLPSELVHAKQLAFTQEGCFALFTDGVVKFNWRVN